MEDNQDQNVTEEKFVTLLIIYGKNDTLYRTKICKESESGKTSEELIEDENVHFVFQLEGKHCVAKTSSQIKPIIKL